MTTKTKKSTKADDGALRAAMAALSKRSTKELRAAYETTMKRSPNGLSRSALIKSLVSTTAADQPPASHPSREEQAKAKAAAKPDSERRRTGARHPLLPPAGTTIERVYKGKTYRVTVRESDLLFDAKPWRSLSAIAMAITGATSISGTLWWGLTKRAATPAESAPTAKSAKSAKAPKAKAARKAKAK